MNLDAEVTLIDGEVCTPNWMASSYGTGLMKELVQNT